MRFTKGVLAQGGAAAAGYQAAVAASSPDYWWKLDTGTPNSPAAGALDLVGVGLSDDEAAPLADGVGAWDYGGVGYSSTSAVSLGNSSGLTFECLIDTADADSTGYLMVHGGSGPVSSVHGEWLHVNGRKIAITVNDYDGGFRRRHYETTADIIDGNSHHIAFTFDAGTIKIYVDGVDQALTLTFSSGAAPTTIMNHSKDIAVGSLGAHWSYAGKFPGVIDEPAVYLKALSGAEVAAHAAAAGF